MRRLVVASAILATLLTMPLSLATAASPATPTSSPTSTPTAPPTPGPTYPSTATDPDRATAALAYLLAAQLPDGSIDKSIGETADFIIGAAAAGYDPATLTGCSGGASALAFLATASDAAVGDAAKTGKDVLAVIAAGQNPAGFSGRNLVARLGALYHAATGKYGDGSTFGQAFAILAVDASGGVVPAGATVELAALQGPDGSWSYGADPAEAGAGDTNSTAIALMALDATGVHAADAAGLAYFKTQQLADGGFPYQNATTNGVPVSDPDSGALVAQAIIAAGQDPASASWSRGSGNALTSIRSAQGAEGGFVFPGSPESAFTTSQVVAALARKPYAASVHATGGRRVPGMRCPGYVPVASPTPTASPSPRPTPSPSVAPAASPTPAFGIAGGADNPNRGAATVIVVVVAVAGLFAALAGWFVLRARAGRR
jgi:hypothetical protein